MYKSFHGIDYEETFPLGGMIESIKVHFTFIIYCEYKIWQMDVKTVLPNGHLLKVVHMVQPVGTVNPLYPNKMYKLKR